MGKLEHYRKLNKKHYNLIKLIADPYFFIYCYEEIAKQKQQKQTTKKQKTKNNTKTNNKRRVTRALDIKDILLNG
jgi:hypothetical protein